MPDVRISDEPSRLIAALPHFGPYSEIGPVFQKAGAQLGASGRQADVVECLAIYHDNPDNTAPDKLRSHAGFSLRQGSHAPAGFETLHLEAGRYAICRHLGAYEGLPETWGWFLGTWMSENNECPEAASMFEIYTNSPETTPSDQLETLIYVQLEDEDFNGPV